MTRRYAVLGDATDPEFWSRTEELLGQLRWVLLATEAGTGFAADLHARMADPPASPTPTDPEPARPSS